MNTHQKGKDFETRFYNALKKELDRNHLGVHPDSCQIFQQKGYYSKDREKDILFDVSIEVFLPGADRWSLLWLWECKDYASSVQVDDIEEFWAKLQQVGGVNIKGGVATTSAFQVSALKFADSKGMSVVRLIPKDQIRWIMYAGGGGRRTTKEEYRKAFTETRFVAKSQEFYGLSYGLLFQEIADMISSMWRVSQEETSRRSIRKYLRFSSVEKANVVFGQRVTWWLSWLTNKFSGTKETDR